MTGRLCRQHSPASARRRFSALRSVQPVEAGAADRGQKVVDPEGAALSVVDLPLPGQEAEKSPVTLSFPSLRLTDPTEAGVGMRPSI